jgi:hypothetical protein
VRGRRKTIVALLLAGSATGTGALVGFAAGVLWAVTGLPPAPAWAVAGLVAAAVLLDAAARWGPGPRPPSVGRQVPQEWSRLFAPSTVAVLYGARLGVGPATILPTWLWWAVLVVAASSGVGGSAAAGAAFGLVRTLLMVALAEWARRAMAPRMAVLRRAEVAVFALVAVAAVAVVAIRPLLAR